MSGTVRWASQRDTAGYWVTTDGRWKAAEHRAKGAAPAVTLTDTTRRAVFSGLTGPGIVGAGPSWVRVAGWAVAEALIVAHRQAER